MNCPKCAAEVDFGRPDCSGCGVDLLQALEARAWAEKSEEDTVPAPGIRMLRSDRALVLVIVALVAAAGAWGLVSTRTPPASPGAWASADQGFAFQPPEGWIVEALLPGDGAWTEALRLSRPPAVLVVLVGGPKPSSPQAALIAAEDRFNGVELKAAAPAVLQVASRDAWSVRLSGERAMLPSPNRGKSLSPLGQGAPAYESMDFEAESVLVPGSRRSYLIQIYSERSDFARARGQFARFLDGFSVL